MSTVVQPDQPVYTQAGFDYGQLAPDVRERVQESARVIHGIERRTSEMLIEMGGRLDDALRELGTSRFEDWVEKEFQWSKRTAYKLISVFRRFKDTAHYAVIAPSALYVLAAESTPDEVRKDFEQVAEAGQKVTHSAVQEAIRERRERAEPVPVQEWDEEINIRVASY